ncbi:MAG TPA: BLUF domain-containing protein [Polyangiaceae bacterium]|nr:BLUF domain-containing protein [Polyangiaceae bacterium]
MYQVFYSSAALVPFSDAELTDLLAVSRANNLRLGVTGMLLYHDGSFLQALEGEETIVERLYAKIGRDERHHRVVALIRRTVDARYFDQWQMGFASMKAIPISVPGYSEYLRQRGKPLESGNVAAQLLAAFRDGRFRSYVQI